MCWNFECDEGCENQAIEVLGRRRPMGDVVYGKRHCWRCMANWTRHIVCKNLHGKVKSDTTWGKNVVCDLVFSKAWSHVWRDVVCDMLSYTTRCRLWFYVACNSMSSAIRCHMWFDVICDLMSSLIGCHLWFDVVCGHLKWRLGLGHDLVFSKHETVYDLV